MKLCYGTTRTVLLIGKYAFKFPSFVEGKLFLHGLLGNMQEKQYSNLNLPEYCPVIFSVPGGFLNVMPRCKPLDRKTFITLDIRNLTNDYLMFNNIVENKQDSYGYYNNRIVAVDYGT